MADLNRQDIIRGMMAEVDGLSHRMAAASLEAVISTITNALSEHRSVMLSDFGKFGVRQRRKRQVTHPYTHEPVQIPSVAVPYFSPSPQLKKRVKSEE